MAIYFYISSFFFNKIYRIVFNATVCGLFFCYGYSQTKDTLLNTVLSKPFFYNVLMGQDQKIFVGTSQGIFEVNGTELKFYDDKIGYITTNQKKIPIIDSYGIKYHRSNSYSHLLPYPKLGSERSYYVGKENYFYICSGGRLYIFDILPYQIKFQNHSIRSISKDITGTYSGIYLRDKKLDSPAPTFTDSYVRQIGNRGFICSYSLYVLEKEAFLSGKLEYGKNLFIYNEPDQLLVNDIISSKDGKSYFVATQNKLLQLSYDFTKEYKLFEKKELNHPIEVFPGFEDKLFFTAENKLYSYHYFKKEIKLEFELQSPIISGIIDGSILYLITKNGFYRFCNNRLDLLTKLERAHTIIPLLGDQFIISTDLGLYNYNLVSNTLSIVIKNVEFNKGALYFESNSNLSLSKIHAGSINGVYVFELGKLPELIENNFLIDDKVPLWNSIYSLFSVLLLLLLLSLWWIISYYRKKLKLVNVQLDSIQGVKNQVTRDQIELYIRNHLADASIKSIMNYFNLNAIQIYSILAPDKPGFVIQNLRMKLLNQMLTDKKTIEEISKATGFSISYLKKIKVKFNKVNLE